MKIIGVEGSKLQVEWPYAHRSRWWRFRLWLAERIADLSYFVWPKDVA